MRKILFLLLLASPCLAGGPKYQHDNAQLNDEITNLYHDVRNVLNGDVRISSVTITTLTVTTINGASPATGNAVLSATQTWTGFNTFTSSVSKKGTTSNDNALTGYVGEVISSVFSAVAPPTSAQWGDATSIALTAGDWDVSYVVEFYASTYSGVLAGVGTASGTSTTGLTAGNITSLTVSTGDSSLSLGGYRVSIAAGATYYLKVNATYAGGSPKMDGGFRARRVR